MRQKANFVSPSKRLSRQVGTVNATNLTKVNCAPKAKFINSNAFVAKRTPCLSLSTSSALSGIGPVTSIMNQINYSVSASSLPL